MTLRRLYLAAAAIPASLALMGSALANHIGLTLGNGGTTIVGFDIMDASTIGVLNISGDAESLDAIDVRPLTGELIGYSSAADEYYLVDPATGNTTRIDTPPTATTDGNNIGIDFNPTIDRLRTVNDQDTNIVFNPNNGATTQVTDLAYNAGDINVGTDPNVSGNAYTNSFGTAETTQQYTLDYNLNTLATLANNAGTLDTVGTLTLDGEVFDFDANTGFDIFSGPVSGTGGNNIAYAVLTSDGMTGLFMLDLASGVLTQAGIFASNLGPLNGLAVGIFENFAEIPIPAALPLFLAGLAGLRLASRRKKQT